MKIHEYCQQLENKIVASYEEHISMEQAEKFAGEFIAAQLVISRELRIVDLDSRMRKASIKSIRAVAYREAVAVSDKKPTEAMLEATVNSNSVLQNEQDRFDEAEANKSELERLMNIFQQAHHYFKGLSKGEY